MIATYDFVTGWTLDGEPETDFLIRFTDADNERAYPVGLSFGYQLIVNGETTETHVWPPENTTIRELTPTRVFSYRLAARPDDEIVLTFWATNSDKTGTGETAWTVPRPDKPYDSWVWDDTNRRWQAPIPYPADGGEYTWDEGSTSWVAISE